MSLASELPAASAARILAAVCRIAGDSSGGTVLYRTVALKDEDGNDITKTLSVGEVAKTAKDSVVEITTEGVTTGNFMMQYVSEGAGSGVILSEDGYIVTNHHVISDATSISVRTTDGKSYKRRLSVPMKKQTLL